MQPKCTHCGNAQCKDGMPTVHVLDVEGGKVIKQQLLCEAAAEALGVLQPKAPPLDLTAELLQSLSSGLKPKTAGTRPPQTTCPGCATTLHAFRERGRLGCPRCYEVFKPHLLRLLDRVHDAVTHRGRFPTRTDTSAPDPVRVTDLHQQLRAAVEDEDYEAAARIRDEIRKLEASSQARQARHPEGS